MAEILGKQEQRQAIWVPDSARPKFKCAMCGKREYSVRSLTDHITSGCAENFRRVNSMREKAPIFYDPEHQDKELLDWVQKHKREILERRKKM